MEKCLQLLKSRKFWAALISLGLILLKAWRPEIQINEDQLTLIVVTLVSFILGVALEDQKRQPAS
jgi:hypothetical protein